MNQLFFASWESIVRTTVVTILAYLLLIVFLRVSGKRTLSKMNAFDFIVTIALGSTLATVMLNQNVPLADGALALFLLIFLQYAISYLSVRFNSVSRLVKSTPTLLAYKGSMLRDVMRKERIVPAEIQAILRKKGFSSLEQADAIALETDGSLTVIGQVNKEQSDLLQHVEKPSI